MDNLNSQPEKSIGKKRTKQIIVICIIVFFVLMGSIGFLVFKLTGSLTTVANDFFDKTQISQYEQAYSLMSTDFKKDVALEDFQEVIKLEEYNLVVEETWTNRSIQNKVGFLDGSITLKDGFVLPLSVFLVKEADGWKIDSIRKLNDQKTEVKKINNTEAETLAINSTLDFYESVSIQDMSVFYNGLAKSWQEQTTIEELNKAFSGLFDDFAYLEPIVMGEFSLDSVEVLDADYNISQIKVSFTDGSKVLNFKLKAILEGVGWKLIGFYLE